VAYAEFHNSEHLRREAHFSFPSGHASTSFSALLFTSLWLLDMVKRHLRAHSAAQDKAICPPAELTDTLAVYACFVPTVIAIYISITRIVDYWHNTDDVLAGVVLGSGCAMIAFYEVHLRGFPSGQCVPSAVGGYNRQAQTALLSSVDGPPIGGIQDIGED
jgi:membrane-associated phospholipid phosphatase